MLSKANNKNLLFIEQFLLQPIIYPLRKYKPVKTSPFWIVEYKYKK